VPISQELTAVMEGIAGAREEPLAEHPLARRIADDWHAAVEQVVNDGSYKGRR
jgi:hypothetical protein